MLAVVDDQQPVLAAKHPEHPLFQAGARSLLQAQATRHRTGQQRRVGHRAQINQVGSVAEAGR